MMNIAKVALVGAVIAFAWGMISWTVLPFHKNSFKTFQNERVIEALMVRSSVDSGIYLLGPKMDEEIDINLRRPKALVAFTKSAAKPDWSNMLLSFLTQLVGAFLIAKLLTKTHKLDYWKKVKFVTVVALAAGILTYIPDLNWWNFSMDYVLLGIADLIIAWFLAGLAMAKMSD